MKESVLVSDHNQLYTMVHTVSTNILSIPVMHLLLWTSQKHNAAMTSMLTNHQHSCSRVCMSSCSSSDSCCLLLQERNKLVPAKRRAEAGQGTTWRALPQEDLKARLAASAVRRKAMTQAMPKDQWDLEKKYASHHVALESCLVWSLHAWCWITVTCDRVS